MTDMNETSMRLLERRTGNLPNPGSRDSKKQGPELMKEPGTAMWPRFVVVIPTTIRYLTLLHNKLSKPHTL